MFWRLSSDNASPTAEFPHFLPHYTRSPRAGDKTFHNLVLFSFPKILLCQFNFFKGRCFILVFNDSYFSYNVAAKCKPPTAFGAWLDHNQSQLHEKHQLCWRYGERVQRPQQRGGSTLLLPSACSTGPAQTLQHTRACVISAIPLLPDQLLRHFRWHLAILQHPAQQVLTNIGLMLVICFVSTHAGFFSYAWEKGRDTHMYNTKSIICPRINNNAF